MNSQRPSVSLRKPEPWTDPVTGEIYPGGNPNEVKTANAGSVPVLEPYTPTAVPQPIKAVRHCTHCGKQIDNNAKFCPGCGAQNDAAGDNVKYCTECRARIPYKAMYCSNCGAQADTAVSGEIKYCAHCGAQISMQSRFCSKCGKEAAGQPQQQTNQPIIINNNIVQNAQPVVIQGGKQRSKWLAFILCFFFGVWGVHRFYEGKVGTGILWLFTGGMFGIGWLVDLIILLTKSDPYYV